MSFVEFGSYLLLDLPVKVEDFPEDWRTLEDGSSKPPGRQPGSVIQWVELVVIFGVE